MKNFEVGMGDKIITVIAEYYEEDINSHLDFLNIDEEGLEDYIATFKTWDYVRVLI